MVSEGIPSAFAFLLIALLSGLWQLKYFGSMWRLQSPAGPLDVTGTLYNWAWTRRVITTILDSYTWTHNRFWTSILDTGPHHLKRFSQNNSHSGGSREGWGL